MAPERPEPSVELVAIPPLVVRPGETARGHLSFREFIPLSELKPSPIEVEDELCEIIKARQRLGIIKYGQTVMSNPSSSHKYWLQHALEEALDLAVYLKRELRKIEEDEANVAVHSPS